MTTVDETKKESRAFEADVAKLLHMMVHSVYSDKDVFLRELISETVGIPNGLVPPSPFGMSTRRISFANPAEGRAALKRVRTPRPMRLDRGGATAKSGPGLSNAQALAATANRRGLRRGG